MTLFELTSVEPPDTGKTVKDAKGRTVRHKPYAFSIGYGPSHATCASCAFLLVNELRSGKRHFKCGWYPVTSGSGTDIRKSDPACAKYEHGPGRQVWMAATRRVNGGYERGRYMFSLKAD